MVDSAALVLAPAAPPARTSSPRVLHLALTRSAAVRLAPVADALGGLKLVIDPTGATVRWSGEPYRPAGDPSLSALDAARSTAAALDSTRPDVALVAGDSDLALAATLAATRAGVPVARVGAGLRSGDRGDPREINRVAIDELAARLYADDADAYEGLRAEGLDERRMRLVGSTTPDVVRHWFGQARKRAIWRRFGLRSRDYAVVSLNKAHSFFGADRLVEGIAGLAQRVPVVVCLPPAGCEERDRAENLLSAAAAAVVADTRDYVDFLSLLSGAAAVVTDSSGVQEETTVLGIPC